MLVASAAARGESMLTRASRGRRSRNKVSVGEPAEGSLSTNTQKLFTPRSQALLWSELSSISKACLFYRCAGDGSFCKKRLVPFFFFFHSHLRTLMPT